MRAYPISTHKITIIDTDLFAILDKYVTNLEEGAVLAVTSKIVAICEGQIVKIGDVDKLELIRKESQYFLPRENNKYGATICVKGNILVSAAGIDESNGDGNYVLWPKDPQHTANAIWHYVRKRFNLKKVGVIITDSRSIPLQRGSSGVAIAHCGFVGIKKYQGSKDIFGRELMHSQVNIMNNLAVSAVLVMGEGEEQTPMAVVEDLPFVEFVENIPTQEELDSIKLTLEDDVFYELLTGIEWQRGQGN